MEVGAPPNKFLEPLPSKIKAEGKVAFLADFNFKIQPE